MNAHKNINIDKLIVQINEEMNRTFVYKNGVQKEVILKHHNEFKIHCIYKTHVDIQEFDNGIPSYFSSVDLTQSGRVKKNSYRRNWSY